MHVFGVTSGARWHSGSRQRARCRVLPPGRRGCWWQRRRPRCWRRRCSGCCCWRSGWPARSTWCSAIRGLLRALASGRRIDAGDVSGRPVGRRRLRADRRCGEGGAVRVGPGLHHEIRAARRSFQSGLRLRRDGPARLRARAVPGHDEDGQPALVGRVGGAVRVLVQRAVAELGARDHPDDAVDPGADGRRGGRAGRGRHPSAVHRPGRGAARGAGASGFPGRLLPDGDLCRPDRTAPRRAAA